MSDEDQEHGARDSRAAASRWARGYALTFGVDAVAHRLRVSTESLARYVAGFPVRPETAARIEHFSAARRISREEQGGKEPPVPRIEGTLRQRRRSVRGSTPAPEPPAPDTQQP